MDAVYDYLGLIILIKRPYSPPIAHALNIFCKINQSKYRLYSYMTIMHV